MAVSAHVQACIDDILTAVYGRDVRQAIHDAVQYTTGIVGTYDSRLEAVENRHATTELITGTTDDYTLIIP